MVSKEYTRFQSQKPPNKIYRAIKVLCYSHNFQNSFLDFHFGAKKFQHFLNLCFSLYRGVQTYYLTFVVVFLLASLQQNSKENSRHLILNLLNLKSNLVHGTFHNLDRMKNILIRIQKCNCTSSRIGCVVLLSVSM